MLMVGFLSRLFQSNTLKPHRNRKTFYLTTHFHVSLCFSLNRARNVLKKSNFDRLCVHNQDLQILFLFLKWFKLNSINFYINSVQSDIASNPLLNRTFSHLKT